MSEGNQWKNDHSPSYKYIEQRALKVFPLEISATVHDMSVILVIPDHTMLQVIQKETMFHDTRRPGCNKL